MRTETTYYAFDETEFDNEQDCLAYEESLNRSMASVIFFNENRKRIVQPTCEDIECYAMYMKIVDADKAEEIFDWLPAYISFEKPKGKLKNGTLYSYNCDNGGWDDMQKIEENLRRIRLELEEQCDDEHP